MKIEMAETNLQESRIACDVMYAVEWTSAESDEISKTWALPAKKLKNWRQREQTGNDAWPNASEAKLRFSRYRVSMLIR